MLHLYPRRFIDEYGPEMKQVLADIAATAEGRARLIRIRQWTEIAADLALAATRERTADQLRRSPHLVTRIGGTASLLGGSIFLISMLTPLRGWTRIGVPASVAAMAAGALGLLAALHGREPRMERLGFTLVGIGLGLGFIGMAGSALGILPPARLAAVLNTGEHAGLLFIGAGMCTWSVLSIRTKALGRLSFAPLPIGLLGLAGITFIDPTTFSTLERGVVPLAFACGWVLLGLALLAAPPNRFIECRPPMPA
jgi:hypothetical protein